MSILNKIQKENDIKKVNKKDYPKLAQEIREFLIDKVSKTGGHLASNLGVVELTIALHLVMNFPEDKLIFDVGHQSYTHKLLTGRREGFESLRKFGGMSGFPKTCESDCDVFNTGHSSTSISAAMGFAVARDLKQGNERIAAVIGDGSLTGGMAYEAINSLSQLKTGLVIILNDNDMSIGKNVGGLSRYLNEIRVGAAYNDFKQGVEHSLVSTKAGERFAKTLKRSKDSIKQLFIPGMFFEELGVTYVGPVDGHDIPAMVSTFEKAFRLNKPIIIHVKTKKGKGYSFAEKRPDRYHGVSAFSPESGKSIEATKVQSYTDVFSKHLIKLAESNERIVAITAAMANGTGLDRFQKRFPKRMYDVGIAEQHAVTFAAGLASAGMVPVVAVYSSFLQRAYDQILHDVCMQKLHVIFAIDRSGLVGSDGETHQGIYDTSYLTHMPGLAVLAPKNQEELTMMLDFAVDYDGPVAVKYPRGHAFKGFSKNNSPIEYGRSELIKQGSRVAVIFCGNMSQVAYELDRLLKKAGVDAAIINARFLNVVDSELLGTVLEECDVVVTLEENVTKGGYGELIAAELLEIEGRTGRLYKHIDGSIAQETVQHGSIDELRKMLGIDAQSMCEKILNELNHENVQE